jgi:hypothetical protein
VEEVTGAIDGDEFVDAGVGYDAEAAEDGGGDGRRVGV